MEQFRISAYVTRESALARGSSSFGHVSVAISDQEIQSLSDGAKELLAQAPWSSDRGLRVTTSSEGLEITDPSSAAVVVALEAVAEKVRLAKEASLAERAERIAMAVASPDDAWVGRDYEHYVNERGVCVYRPSVMDSPREVNLNNADKQDPAVVARREQVRSTHLPERLASWERGHSENESRLEADKAKREEEDRRQMCLVHEARLWAAEHAAARLGSPELARAAREERDVHRTITARSDERVAMTLGSIAGEGRVVETFGSEERKGVPSRDAYALMDFLTGKKDLIAAAAGLPGVSVSIGPVERLDVAPTGPAVWRTGIVVTVEHPWLTGYREFSVLAEPIDADGDTDE